MTNFITTNISGSTGGHSGPPLRRDFVSVTHENDDFENVRVQAECRARPGYKVPKRGNMSDVMRR